MTEETNRRAKTDWLGGLEKRMRAYLIVKSIIVLSFGLIVVAVGCHRGPKTCAVCERGECIGLTFQITLANGKKVDTCCPRCGLHYVHDHSVTPRSLSATDIITGKRTDATKAVYVEGSDVSHCAAKDARRDAYGCCYFKGYDRCEPSLIAFASPEAAGKFQKEHGGRLVMFGKLQLE